MLSLKQVIAKAVLGLSAFTAAMILYVSIYLPRNQASTQQTVVHSPAMKCQLIAEAYSTACKPRLHMLPTSFSSKLECSFDLMNHTEYLPSRDLIACLESRVPIEWASDAKRLQKSISALQFPTQCDEPNSKDFTRPSWTFGRDSNNELTRVASKRQEKERSSKWNLVTFMNHGWGYNLYVMAWNCGNHWANGIPVMVGNSNYRFTDNECGRSWSCFLSPLTNCTVESTPASKILVYSTSGRPQNAMSLDQVCKPNGTYRAEYGRCQCNNKYIPHTDVNYLFCKPYNAFDLNIKRKQLRIVAYERNKTEALMYTKYPWFGNQAPGEQNPHNTDRSLHYRPSILRRKYGWLWFHGQSLKWLVYNSRKKKQLEEYRASVGLTNKTCIAVHVRHGDSCYDAFQSHRNCHPLQVYMKKVQDIVDLYGPVDVLYLATDDEKVAQNISQYASTFNIVLQNLNRSFYDNQNGVDRDPKYNSPKLVADINRDIWAMIHCKAIVGSMASSIMWVVYELIVALRGYYVPFVSIDLPYGYSRNVKRFMDKPNL